MVSEGTVRAVEVAARDARKLGGGFVVVVLKENPTGGLDSSTLTFTDQYVENGFESRKMIGEAVVGALKTLVESRGRTT